MDFTGTGPRLIVDHVVEYVVESKVEETTYRSFLIDGGPFGEVGLTTPEYEKLDDLPCAQALIRDLRNIDGVVRAAFGWQSVRFERDDSMGWDEIQPSIISTLEMHLNIKFVSIYDRYGLKGRYFWPEDYNRPVPHTPPIHCSSDSYLGDRQFKEREEDEEIES